MRWLNYTSFWVIFNDAGTPVSQTAAHSEDRTAKLKTNDRTSDPESLVPNEGITCAKRRNHLHRTKESLVPDKGSTSGGQHQETSSDPGSLKANERTSVTSDLESLPANGTERRVAIRDR